MDFIHCHSQLFNAPINVEPQEGGGADPVEFDIFMEARVKFLTPQAPSECQFPTPGVTFSIRVRT